MEWDFKPHEVSGILLILLICIASFKGCSDPQHLTKYNYCMEGTPKPVFLLKALFQCVWV
jgi:hypothetical protein